uniref:Fork-head domain-containing protein n=1 Tax=Takifugu rubripes TaxID=31033 RepID=A0A674P972_TAKRU
METFGTLCAPVGSSQQRLFRKSSTYLAKIAVVLQCAPEKMLTFPQLMDHLMPIMSENRRSFENNIRVCLSTNKCFVKIPVVPDSLDSKRKYWKLDSSQITAKMARRHFKGILQLFPELASKVEAENRSRTLGGQGSLKAPEAAAAAARRVQNRREVKFSGPFSIESLLKRDGPSARTSRSSPLSGAQVRAEQQPPQHLAIQAHDILPPCGITEGRPRLKGGPLDLRGFSLSPSADFPTEITVSRFGSQHGRACDQGVGVHFSAFLIMLRRVLHSVVILRSCFFRPQWN